VDQTNPSIHFPLPEKKNQEAKSINIAVSLHVALPSITTAVRVVGIFELKSCGITWNRVHFILPYLSLALLLDHFF
jgi:hypothetical protein